MEYGVRPERAPGLGAPLDVADGRQRRAQRAGERLAHAEIAGGERVRQVQRAHREVVRGPRPDAGQRRDLGDVRLELARAVEADGAGGDRGREPVQRGGARRGDAEPRDRGGAGRGDLARGREPVRQPVAAGVRLAIHLSKRVYSMYFIPET